MLVVSLYKIFYDLVYETIVQELSLDCYTAWCKVIKRIWKIPSTTHCNLCTIIAYRVFNGKWCAKFILFIYLCLNSPNLIVRTILKVAKTSIFSGFWNWKIYYKSTKYI